jgi:hypothetical protein
MPAFGAREARPLATSRGGGAVRPWGEKKEKIDRRERER